MVRNLFYGFLFALCLSSCPAARADVLEDDASVSVYAYFNVTEDEEDSSLTFENFQEQVDEIGIGNYTVLNLADLFAKEEAGEDLSPNTIAITFDEPNAETYARAIPLLVKNKIPFTIFVSPGSADDIEWQTLNNLAKNDFVTVGLTSFTYGHLGNWTEEQLTEDLNKAKGIYREKMGAEPLYFSYPLGEYSETFVSVVKKMGFAAAFGQNSGVITKSLDHMRLPRFTMTEEFGDLDRFRTTSNAMPFPVKDIEPNISYLPALPAIGFTIDGKIAEGDMKKTKCFASGSVQPDTSYLGSGRVEIRFPQIPVTDRLRINCTIPVAAEIEDDDPRYRWLGFLLYFPVTVQSDADLSPAQP